MHDDPLASGPLGGYLWRVLAVAGGSIVSLSLRSWETMSWKQNTMGFFVAFSFGLFFTPVYLDFIIKQANLTVGAAGGIYFATATASTALIPRMIKWMGDKTPSKPENPE